METKVAQAEEGWILGRDNRVNKEVIGIKALLLGLGGSAQLFGRCRVGVGGGVGFSKCLKL